MFGDQAAQRHRNCPYYCLEKNAPAQAMFPAGSDVRPATQLISRVYPERIKFFDLFLLRELLADWGIMLVSPPRPPPPVQAVGDTIPKGLCSSRTEAFFFSQIYCYDLGAIEANHVRLFELGEVAVSAGVQELIIPAKPATHRKASGKNAQEATA